MAKGLEVCHKIDFTHTHILLSFLSFIFAFYILMITFLMNSCQYTVLPRHLGRTGQEHEEGEMPFM